MNRAIRGSLVLVLTVSGGASAVAQLPYDPVGSAALNAAGRDARQQRAEAIQLAKARQELAQQERAAIAEVAQQLAAAKAAHRAAGKDLTATKEKSLDEIETSLGVKRAQEELTAAQAAYDAAAKPVLEKLKASPEYIEAGKKSSAAKLSIKELQSDTSLTEVEKAPKRKALIGDSMAVANLEQFTLQKEPQVAAAQDRVVAARKTVAELKRKASDKAENDSAVSTAREAVKTALAGVKAAENNLAAVQSQAANAGQLLQAGIVPKKADQGGKGNEGKGPKKK